MAFDIKKNLITGGIIGLIIPAVLAFLATVLQSVSLVSNLLSSSSPSEIGMKAIQLLGGNYLAIFPDALIVAGVYAVLYTLGVWIDKQSWSPSYPGEFMRTMLAFFYGQAGATVLLIALGTPIAVSLMLLAGM